MAMVLIAYLLVNTLGNDNNFDLGFMVVKKTSSAVKPLMLLSLNSQTIDLKHIFSQQIDKTHNRLW